LNAKSCEQFGPSSKIVELAKEFIPEQSFDKNSLNIMVEKNITPLITMHQMVSSDMHYRIEKGWISPRYGIKQQAQVIVFEKESVPPINFVTLIVPIKYIQ